MRVMFPASDEARLVEEFFAGCRGYFVEVGANEPEVGSQTLHLERKGWHGILIEPLPELARELRRRRSARVFQVACSAPENSGRTMALQVAGIYSTVNAQLANAKAQAAGTLEVTARTLDEVLVEAGAPVPIDFLSIDVEGHEIEVLRGFDIRRWQPRLILIEDLVLDRRLHRVLTASGYIWIRRTAINSWYVPALPPVAIGMYGRLQFFRKYYLGVPFRRLREASRRVRRRLDLIREV